jgi:hypothetical protein
MKLRRRERVALWFLMTIGLCGCAHPELVKAAAGASTAAAADTGSSSAAGAQVKTGTDAQAAASTTVSVKRAPRHLALSVTPAVDGGQPTFTLDLDEGGDEIFASSTGAADAGAAAEVDAGAGASADAGAASSADAGAEAKVEPERPAFWNFSRVVTLLIGIVAVVGLALVVVRRLRP